MNNRNHWGYDLLGLILTLSLYFVNYDNVIEANPKGSTRDVLGPLFKLVDILGGKVFVYIIISIIALFFFISLFRKIKKDNNRE